MISHEFPQVISSCISYDFEIAQDIDDEHVVAWGQTKTICIFATDF